jgi:uncharacterized YccA/Bax inhibitor family protein
MPSNLVRSSNPALTEKTFEQYRVQPDPTAAGWAAPPAGPGAIPDAPPSFQPPAAGTAVMTNGGVTTATGVLLVLLVAGAVVGWNSTTINAEVVEIPGWTLLAILGALGLAILTIFKPLLARFTGPLYALLEGTAVGAISAVYNAAYDGIVMQAVGLTIGVFAVMLFLHATRLIRVTEKLRTCIIAATGAIALMYLFCFIASLFGSNVTFLHDGSTFGILLSLFIVGQAAYNLLLDFDFLERGDAAGIDKRMEWFAAFGLLLTLVWLYLELLRLLARLQRR